MLGEGKLVFRSPQMHILKSNKALLDYISNHEMSKEDVRKIRSYVKESEKNRKEGMRVMKEIRRKINEELAKMMKKYKKMEEDGG